MLKLLWIQKSLQPSSRQTVIFFFLQWQMQSSVQLGRSSKLPLALLGPAPASPSPPSFPVSLWPEIMWSDYAHGSSDVFPKEFDRDGGREDGNGAGRERRVQQVATGTDLWPDFNIKGVCSSVSDGNRSYVFQLVVTRKQYYAFTHKYMRYYFWWLSKWRVL